MTDKRMIDADAFEKLLEWIVGNEEYVNDFVDIDGDYVRAYPLKKKINELATPAPVTQEGDRINKSDYNLDKNKNFMG